MKDAKWLQENPPKCLSPVESGPFVFTTEVRAVYHNKGYEGVEDVPILFSRMQAQQYRWDVYGYLL